MVQNVSTAIKSVPRDDVGTDSHHRPNISHHGNPVARDIPDTPVRTPSRTTVYRRTSSPFQGGYRGLRAGADSAPQFSSDFTTP